MDQKIENSDKKKSKKKGITLLLILLLLFGIGAVVWNVFLGDKNSNNEKVVDDLAESNIQEPEQKNEEAVVDENLNNKNKNITPGEDVEMVSENYKVSQVKFGGNVIIEDGKSRDTKLEIYQVKSENIISQEDDEPRILISWKTNKEAISTVNYSKANGGSVVNVSEDGYGFDHTMLLKNMEFSTIYTYKIEVKDKWGNKVNTEYFSAYTGDKSESIFDLITNAVEDVFGWAMK